MLEVQELTFADVLVQAPPIHVSERGRSITVLKGTAEDRRRMDSRFGENRTEGDGSRESPYRYRSAAAVSPHYAIVDLWFGCRAEAENSKDVFITSNGWLLRVTLWGVIAEDRYMTRLLPR